MLKLVVIGAFLTAFQYNGTNAEKNATVVKEITLHHPHSYTLSTEPHLLTIAGNSTHLLINSTDINFKPCAIAFGDHSIQQKIEATTIDHKIIVWGLRTKYQTNQGDRIEHTILIVDPAECDFKAASTFEEQRPGGLFNPDENLARVVAHDDSFDVFYPSLRTCAPCRYSIDGKRISLPHQLERNNKANSNAHFRIQSYGKPGHDIKYLYAHNFGNGQSVVELLDENFRVAKQKFLDHGMDVIAADPNASSGVHVCYMTQVPWRHKANDTIYCEHLDADLNPSWSIRLPMLEGHAPDALSVNVVPSGDLLVAVIQSEAQDSSLKKFGYYWVDSNGKLHDSARVYELPEGVYGRRKIRGFLADDKYCIESKDVDGWRNGHEFVKCVLV